MARPALTDFLQAHTFWLMDAGLLGPDNLPVFTPLAGFASVTAPEMNLELEEVTEGNSFSRKKYVKRVDTGGISLTQGVNFANSDFWRWARNAAGGAYSLTPFPTTPRRDLVLTQFFPRWPGASLSTVGVAAAAAATIAFSISGSLATGVSLVASAGAATIAPLGSRTGTIRVPARAWVLSGCIPTRYKAGSDFDAANAAISIAELDLAVEEMDEIGLV